MEHFTGHLWKYYLFGPPEYHGYPDPPLAPSQPPTISDVIVAPFWTSILVSYTVADDVDTQGVYAQLLDSNYAPLELKHADDVPDGAVSYAAVFEFPNLAPGNSYIVKMYGVGTNDNIASRKEYTEIVDMTAPVINDFTITSPVAGQLKVDVNVTDDSGGSVFCSASLYWILTPDIEIDYYYIELIDGAGSVTFPDLDPERTYLVELLVWDPSWKLKYETREGYPNGAGGL